MIQKTNLVERGTIKPKNVNLSRVKIHLVLKIQLRRKYSTRVPSISAKMP